MPIGNPVSDREWLAIAMMLEGDPRGDDNSYHRVADVLNNRRTAEDRATRYGSGAGTFEGQFKADNTGIQFSSAHPEEASDASSGTVRRYNALTSNPRLLTDADRAQYQRMFELAGAWTEPGHPQYQQYAGIARGADYFDNPDVVTSWSSGQPWGNNAFAGGEGDAHTYRKSTPGALQPEWAPGRAPITPVTIGGTLGDPRDPFGPDASLQGYGLPPTRPDQFGGGLYDGDFATGAGDGAGKGTTGIADASASAWNQPAYGGGQSQLINGYWQSRNPETGGWELSGPAPQTNMGTYGGGLADFGQGITPQGMGNASANWWDQPAYGGGYGQYAPPDGQGAGSSQGGYGGYQPQAPSPYGFSGMNASYGGAQPQFINGYWQVNGPNGWELAAPPDGQGSGSSQGPYGGYQPAAPDPYGFSQAGMGSYGGYNPASAYGGSPWYGMQGGGGYDPYAPPDGQGTGSSQGGYGGYQPAAPSSYGFSGMNASYGGAQPQFINGYWQVNGPNGWELAAPPDGQGSGSSQGPYGGYQPAAPDPYAFSQQNMGTYGGYNPASAYGGSPWYGMQGGGGYDPYAPPDGQGTGSSQGGYGGYQAPAPSPYGFSQAGMGTFGGFTGDNSVASGNPYQWMLDSAGGTNPYYSSPSFDMRGPVNGGGYGGGFSGYNTTDTGAGGNPADNLGFSPNVPYQGTQAFNPVDTSQQQASIFSSDQSYLNPAWSSLNLGTVYSSPQPADTGGGGGGGIYDAPPTEGGYAGGYGAMTGSDGAYYEGNADGGAGQYAALQYKMFQESYALQQQQQAEIAAANAAQAAAQNAQVNSYNPSYAPSSGFGYIAPVQQYQQNYGSAIGGGGGIGGGYF